MAGHPAGPLDPSRMSMRTQPRQIRCTTAGHPADPARGRLPLDASASAEHPGAMSPASRAVRLARSALLVVVAVPALAATTSPASAATDPVLVTIGSSRNDEGAGVATYG